jgi:hypothetical protein
LCSLDAEAKASFPFFKKNRFSLGLVALKTVMTYLVLKLQRPVFSKLCVNVHAHLQVVRVVNQEMGKEFCYNI